MPEKILNIHLEKQESDNWCYAAIIKAINDYYKLPTVSQNNIASTFNKKYEMQNPYQLLVSLNLIDKSQGTLKDGVKFGMPSWNDVVNNINNDRPIVSMVGQHYILLIGYSGKNNRDSERKYIFLDPLVGSEKGNIYVTYDTLLRKGFSTNYEHKGELRDEHYVGSLFTKPPINTGGKRKTYKNKKFRTKTKKIKL